MNTKTDLEKLKSLFDGFKIGYTQYERDEQTIIKLMVGDQNIDGYTGFGSSYVFDTNEHFIEVVIYE